jgi:hypothetical protein
LGHRLGGDRRDLAFGLPAMLVQLSGSVHIPVAAAVRTYAAKLRGTPRASPGQRGTCARCSSGDLRYAGTEEKGSFEERRR